MVFFVFLLLTICLYVLKIIYIIEKLLHVSRECFPLRRRTLNDLLWLCLSDTGSSMNQKGIMGNVALLVITDMTIRSTACRFVFELQFS